MVWLEDPRRDNNKWPAIIFAVSRIDRVTGRIINLIHSISTIKGIKSEGVWDGVKWENNRLVKLIHSNNIILNHKEREKDKQNLIWLEEVKMNGNNPMKLLNKIIIKSLKKIIKLEKENLIIVLNSFSKNDKI